MKYLVAASAVTAAALFASPAHAHIVQATTSLSLTDVDVHDTGKLEEALRSAVEEVLSNVIAFTPSLVTLTDAEVVGERLYVRLLIADEAGERMLQDLHRGDDQAGPGAGPRPDAAARTVL
jgi:hypothetical protein